MEFSRSDLPKAIYYILTLYPNKKFSTTEMFDHLVLENACPELTAQIFTRHVRANVIDEIYEAMNIVSTNYNNVYVVNNKCYLKQTPKNIEMLKKNIDENTIKRLDIRSLNYDGDSLLHILCKYGENDLLELIAKYHNINITQLNKNNESLLDVVLNNNNDITFKTLAKIVLEQTKKNHEWAMTNMQVFYDEKCNRVCELTMEKDALLTQLRYFYFGFAIMVFIFMTYLYKKL